MICPEVKSDISDRSEGNRGERRMGVREVVPHTRAGLACQPICEKGLEGKEDLKVLLFLVAVKLLADYRRERGWGFCLEIQVLYIGFPSSLHK